MKILNFGSCNMDYVYEVEHIVRRGETLAADKLSIFPGGKGLNQSIAIAKAGAPICFAGCIGEDGAMLEQVLKQAGVDVQNLRIVKEPTGHAIIQVDENGENSIVIYRGANGSVTKEYIDRVLEQFDRDDILLVQNEINNLLYLIEKAAKKGMKIILNPSPFDNVLKSINLNHLYCIVLNETEAMQWTGTQDPQDFLFLVRKDYSRLQVLLTFGEKGSVYLKNGELYRQPAFKVSAIDTTAAGDTFTGYFVAGLYGGTEITEILRTSAAAAAIAVSRKGASSSIPTYEEVERQIATMQLGEICS